MTSSNDQWDQPSSRDYWLRMLSVLNVIAKKS